MAQKLYLTWYDIEKDCQTIAKKLKGKHFDLVVAITKGGLPIATILGNKYIDNPPVITLQLKECVHGAQKANYQGKKVKVISPLNTFPIKNKKVLIIDDVSDSGFSLKKAIQLVQRKKPKKILTACLHLRPRSLTKPDVFSRKIDDNVWIVYPWENKKIRP